MRKLQAWTLTLALFFALTIPAAAAAEETTPLPTVADLVTQALPEPQEDDYWTGYLAGYDVGYEEGYAAGLLTGGTGENPYPYQESYDWETYEDGYAEGLYEGYDSGLIDASPYWVAYNDAFDRGYAEGLVWGRSVYPDMEAVEAIPYEMDDSDLQDAQQGSRDGYTCGYSSGAYDGYWEGEEALSAQQAQQIREDNLVAAGGTPGQINVMVNDTCLAFPDAYPQIRNDRTMVPLRGVMEALGATVEYNDGAITVLWKDTVLTTAVGLRTVDVQRGEEYTPLTMDCASYIDGNRTYVPLRFFSQAVGYDVLWDQDYRTAVLLDREALTAAVNEDFSTLNLFLALQKGQLEQGLVETVDMRAQVEIIDTIDGNKTATVTGRSTAHAQGMTLDATASLDLTQLWDLLADAAPLLDATPDDMAALKETYSEITLSLKVDEEGAYYLQCPQLAPLYGAVIRDGAAAGPDTWIKLTQLDPETLAGDLTMGDFLYSLGDAVAQPFFFASKLVQVGENLAGFMGDDTFTRQGLGYQWSFGVEELVRLLNLSPQDRAELETYLQTCTLTLSFRPNGAFSLQGAVKVVYPGLGALLNLTTQSEGTTTGSTSQGAVQVRNLVNLTFNSTTRRQASTTAPNTTLPEGADILDLTDALFGF